MSTSGFRLSYLSNAHCAYFAGTLPLRRSVRHGRSGAPVALLSAVACILATLAMGCELFGFPPLETERRPVARGRIGDLAFATDRAARTVDAAAYFSDPDGDVLSFKAASSNRNVAAVRTDRNAVTITPGTRGVATITVTATDPGGLSAVQRFQVSVGNQPPLPRGTIGGLSLTVDASGHAVEVAAYFTDPDDDPLTYEAESSDRDVATVGTAGSTLTITPVAQGAATITVTATDGGGLSAVQRFPVMVDNRAPAAQDSISVAPLAAAARTVELDSFFTDPDGDALAYEAESSDENVATVGTAGSTLTIAPVARGIATITVTATDPGGLSAVQRFPVTVDNQAPTAQGTIAGISLTAGAAARTVDVAAYFSDPEDDALTYEAESSNRNVATVRSAGSTLTITPAARGATTVSTTITVTATDPGGLSAVQQFHVSVNNRAPAPRGTIAAQALDSAPRSVDVAAYFSDPEGDTLTYEAESSDENVAAVDSNGSTLTITPVARGAATITVTAADPGGLTAVQRFPVTVNNQAPKAQGTTAVPSLAADAHSVELDSLFFDPEGDALTYEAESSNENVATVATDGSTLTITPVARGAATVTVTATDPAGLRAVQQLPVTVDNQAPLPQGAISGLSLKVGASAGTVDVASFFSDPDGDALTYEAESSNELVATARAAGSTVSVTPQSRGGTARITVTASDPGGLTAEQQFRVFVGNRAPVPRGAISMPALDAAPRSVDVAAYFTDPDDHELTYEAESSNENVATAGTVGSTVTIAPVARGAATITVTAADPGGLRAVQRFAVTVNNQAPAAQGSISAPPPLDPAGAAHAVDVVSFFSDPEGDELTYEAESSNELVATAGVDGSTVSVTPRAKGSATVTVTATDPGNLSAIQQFPVTVKNRPPAAQGSIPAPPALDPAGAAHAVDVVSFFSDPDGDELIYEAESSNELVAAARAAGSTVSVTPRARGRATITVTATDPGNLSATQQFPVTVKNRPPAAQGSISAPPPLSAGDVAHAFDVATYFSDPDGDELTYEAESSNDLVATAGAGGSTVSVTPRAEGSTTITVTATDPGDLSATQEFPVTVRPPAPLKLLSLTVTGGSGSLYPAFAAGIHHYAVRCRGGTTLRVQAQASRTAATVTLLRAATSNNRAATGVLDASVAVNGDHDVVIELRQGTDTATYVVHCLPADFPEVRILKKTAAVAEGLLLVTPRSQISNTYESVGSVSYMAILDNNGVPRFHRRLRPPGRNLRRLADGRYSLNSAPFVEIYDAQLRYERTVRPLAPLRDTDEHDFLITPEGNYLFIDYVPATRDECEVRQCEPDEKKPIAVRDSWIQEVTPGGTSVFEWNSWDHLKLSDCRFDLDYHRGEYAHLNSLHLVGGDVIASFRHCSMVVRIDRSSGTGALVWQVGGSAPPRAAATRYLSISDDSTGQNEICGQHDATITGSGSLLVYDNGNLCQGPRKQAATFSRVVEYRLDADKAVLLRQYLLPAGHGFSSTRGSVVELPNGNWLIAWGTFAGASLPYDRRLSISEVDPGTGRSVFDVNMHSVSDRRHWYTYRVYRVPESAVQVPHNLP